MSIPGENIDMFIHMKWTELMDKTQMDKTQMDTSYAILSPQNLQKSFQPLYNIAEESFSTCAISLEDQDSRDEFTSQIHLPICTETDLTQGVLLNLFHDQSNNLRWFGYSFISILWITLMCSGLQREQSEGCINNNKVDGVLW